MCVFYFYKLKLNTLGKNYQFCNPKTPLKTDPSYNFIQNNICVVRRKQKHHPFGNKYIGMSNLFAEEKQS